MKTQIEPLSSDSGDGEFYRNEIIAWWNALRTCDDPGAATWEDLDGLELAVTECLSEDCPNIEKAIHLTAHAMLLVDGRAGI